MSDAEREPREQTKTLLVRAAIALSLLLVLILFFLNSPDKTWTGAPWYIAGVVSSVFAGAIAYFFVGVFEFRLTSKLGKGRSVLLRASGGFGAFAITLIYWIAAQDPGVEELAGTVRELEKDLRPYSLQELTDLLEDRLPQAGLEVYAKRITKDAGPYARALRAIALRDYERAKWHLLDVDASPDGLPTPHEKELAHGHLEFYQGKFNSAAQRYGSAEAMLRRSGANTPDILRAVALRARALFSAARYSDARSCFEEIQRLGTGKQRVSALYQLAQVDYFVGSFASAKRKLTECRGIYQKGLGSEGAFQEVLLDLQAARIARAMGDRLEALKFADRAWNTVRSTLQPGKIHIDLLFVLASLAKDMGDLQAAVMKAEEGIRLSEQQLGKDHPAVGIGWNNFGTIRMVLREYEAAEKCFLKGLRILRKTIGEDHDETARITNNLAGAYLKLGQTAKAENAILRALAVRKALLGEMHPDVADSLRTLSQLEDDRENHDGAIELMQQAVKIHKRAFGEIHPEVASDFQRLGYLQKKKGNLESALKESRAALAVRERVFGTNHEAVVSAQNDVGECLLLLGRHGEATETLRKAVQRANSVGEPDGMLRSMVNLAKSVLAEIGREPASQILDQAAVVVGELGKGGNQSLGASLNRAGVLFYGFGRYAEAADALRKGAGILDTILGERDPDVIRSKLSLAAVYNRQGRRRLAEEILKGCAANASLLGERHMALLAKVFDAYGSTLYDMGRFKEARRFFLETAKIVERKESFEFEGNSNQLNSLGATLVAIGRVWEGRELLEKGLRVLVANRGSPAIQIALIINMAVADGTVWKYRAAEEHLKKADALLSQLKSADRFWIEMQLCFSLTSVYTFQRRLDEAERWLKRAWKLSRRLHGGRGPLEPIHLIIAAQFLMAEGRLIDARREAGKALELFSVKEREGSVRYARCLITLGEINLRLGNKDEGEKKIDRALKMLSKAIGSQNLLVALARIRVGVAMLAAGQSHRAEALFRLALGTVRMTNRGLEEVRVVLANGLEGALKANGKNEEADRLARELKRQGE